MTDATRPPDPLQPAPEPGSPSAEPAGAAAAPAAEARPAAATGSEREVAEPAASPAEPAVPGQAAEPTAGPPSAPPPSPAPRARRGFLEEPPEIAAEVPRRQLAAQSRRDFLLLAGGTIATAVLGWWVLPDATRQRLLPPALRARLDALAARAGLTPGRRERALDRALDLDDDVAEALTSGDRSVRTYPRSRVTALMNNYHGRTPGPEILAGWSLGLSGLASGGTARLALPDLLGRFAHREQVTRLVCVEGWSAIAWWGGLRFADLLAAFPAAPGARWAAIRSSVSLDEDGRPEPYYVSIDLATARHPQTLLATHQNGRPLTLAHGAPLRLVAPMKLGLKNIKAITDIAYTAAEPPDYWNERGYSRYDGL